MPVENPDLDMMFIMTKETLPKIKLETPENTVDVMFDIERDDHTIADKMGFLKNTRLSNIQVSNTDSNQKFTITNKESGESLDFSNRVSSLGEMRGKALRNLIDKHENKEQTLYDCIAEEVTRMPTYVNLLAIKSNFAYAENERQDRPPALMTPTHFNLFIAICANHINNAVKSSQEKLTLDQLKSQPELADTLWEGIDIQDVYNSTKAVCEQLEAITNEADLLRGKGAIKAADTAQVLCSELNKHIDDLFNEKVDVKAFNSQCDQSLHQAAEHPDLKTHYGFLSNIYHGIRAILNKITGGAVKIEPSEAIKKTQNFKRQLSEAIGSVKENNLVEPSKEKKDDLSTKLQP